MSDEVRPRYFLIQEKDRSWSICDRQIMEAEKKHRLVTAMTEKRALELVAKLNAASNG